MLFHAIIIINKIIIWPISQNGIWSLVQECTLLSPKIYDQKHSQIVF